MNSCGLEKTNMTNGSNYSQISVGITFFHPNETDLQILDQICPIFGLVIIYDNTNVHNESVCKLAESFDNICYLANQHNDGVAVALNQMANIAKVQGYKKIVFFDQDSRLPNKDLLLYLDNVLSIHNDKVAIISPNIICDYVINENAYVDAPPIKECDWLITSGSCLNLTAYEDIGIFDENLFIDLVDTDFCIRARAKGYRLLQLSSPIMRHSLGDVYSILNIKYYCHSPLRIYYQVRNKIYLSKKHPNIIILGVIFSILKVFLKITFLEKNKLFRFKMVFKGIADAKNSVMGKYIE